MLSECLACSTRMHSVIVNHIIVQGQRQPALNKELAESLQLAATIIVAAVAFSGELIDIQK